MEFYHTTNIIKINTLLGYCNKFIPFYLHFIIIILNIYTLLFIMHICSKLFLFFYSLNSSSDGFVDSSIYIRKYLLFWIDWKMGWGWVRGDDAPHDGIFSLGSKLRARLFSYSILNLYCSIYCSYCSVLFFCSFCLFCACYRKLTFFSPALSLVYISFLLF